MESLGSNCATTAGLFKPYRRPVFELIRARVGPRGPQVTARTKMKISDASACCYGPVVLELWMSSTDRLNSMPLTMAMDDH